MMNRIIEFNNTRRHRKEVQRIAKELGYSFPFHDFHKMINILLFGDKFATKLHRKYCKHHEQNGDIKNKIEAAIDWESARFTKPDKPLNSYQTWKKYYSHIDMSEVMKKLNFFE